MKKLKSILIKWHTAIHILLSFLFGAFFNRHIDIVNKSILRALVSPTSIYYFLAALVLIIVVVYHYYIEEVWTEKSKTKKWEEISKNKKVIIEGLLASITNAILWQFPELTLESKVQVCHGKVRKTEYVHNPVRQDGDIPLWFGHVGEQCIKKRDTLFITLDYNDWANGSEKYRNTADKGLRLIAACPIIKANKVIAVLEIDIYENTTIWKEQGQTKTGYVTNELKSDSLKNSLQHTRIRQILTAWASAISFLIKI